MSDYITVTSTLAIAKICTEKTQSVTVSIPFTLRDYPENLSKFSVHNDFSCLPFKLEFPEKREISSFKQMLEKQKKAVKDKRQLFLGIGFYYMMKGMVRIVKPLMNSHSDRVANNVTTVFSIVPGSLKHWDWIGIKHHEIFYVATGGGALSSCISVITQAGQCQIGLACDEVYFPNDSHKKFI